MAAREAYQGEGYEVQYHDVKKDQRLLGEMLKFSKGGRSVPVIVEGEKISIGYGGS